MGLQGLLAYKFGGVDREDLESELRILEWEHRQRPASHIRQRMRWYSMDYYVAAKKRREALVYAGDEIVNQFPGPDLEVTFSTLVSIIDMAFNCGDAAGHKKIFHLAAQGYTIRESARILGTSRSSISRFYKVIKRIVRDSIN